MLELMAPQCGHFVCVCVCVCVCVRPFAFVHTSVEASLCVCVRAHVYEKERRFWVSCNVAVLPAFNIMWDASFFTAKCCVLALMRFQVYHFIKI